MPYGNKITTSKHGRRLGLQQMSSSESGGSYGNKEFLVGPEDLRAGVSTGAVNSDTLPAYGISRLSASAGSSAVYTLDPPIPGVMKHISVTANSSSIYIATKNDETFVSSAGTTEAAWKSTAGAVGTLTFMGLTTGIWFVVYVASSFTAIGTTS